METYTMVKLPVSESTFNEILKKLIDAGYEGDYVGKGYIDMREIRLVQEVEKPLIAEDKMVKINGKSFRCECDCNVFRNPEGEPEIYVCNCCGNRYRGE